MEGKPSVYLLQGENDLAIQEYVAQLFAEMGDPTLAELNTTRLDGKTASLDDLETAMMAVPFLCERRLVVFTNPTQRLNTPAAQARFKALLNNTPRSTALVIVEHRFLSDDRPRKKDGQKSQHWLEKWALDAKEFALGKLFPLPSGEELDAWIQARVRTAGGGITHQAASYLAGLLGNDLRVADQEIQKLLTFVNFARPIEIDDVQKLTPSIAKVGDFALVNALRQRNRRQAQIILHRMLADVEPVVIFGMIVSQFRLLLLAREALDIGGSKEQLARQLRMHTYPVQLAMEQARHYTIDFLEATYRRLLDFDESIKTGLMPAELALDLLVIEVTR